MLRILVYLIFIITVALAAMGIILSSRLRSRYRAGVFSTLLYYQVFIYTFGFYGIWGQVLINSFLSPLVSGKLLLKITDISMLLGLPFLVFAWLMQVAFSSGISGRKSNSRFAGWFLLLNFSVLLIVGYIITTWESVNSTVLMKDYFIIMNLVYSFISANLIHFTWKGRSLINDFDRRVIAPAIFLVMIAQCVPLVFYISQPWLGLIFIFTFFIGNTFLPVYFTYGTISEFTNEPVKEKSFDDFCRKYEISPRESDIIREICNGLSNKEISDKLFISLQTVKDHSHRIYIKTNVRSRVQLINLVKEKLARPADNYTGIK
jgi:DNA-binding CsgD family transcriptional regulator